MEEEQFYILKKSGAWTAHVSKTPTSTFGPCDVDFVVDSKVRDQLSPSPVDHKDITARSNQWIRFI